MTDNLITEFLRKRTIISDFQLIEHIVNSEKDYAVLPPYQDEVRLSSQQLLSIIESWKKSIANLAAFLEKSARSVMAKTQGNVLYVFNIKDNLLFQSALICEIFRYPGISKNSSLLDFRKLQNHIASLLQDKDKPLELMIAWGQAKQTCGLLKTPGSMADLAEVFAIAQLSVILQAVKRVLGGKREVKLTVLTGASRFAMAFYPNIVINEQYDKQRQCIADFFNDPGEVVFTPFTKPSTAAQDEKRLPVFEANCQLVKPQHIEKIYNHILLSINWHDVLTGQYKLERDEEDRYLSKPLCQWLQDSTDFEKVLRQAIVCLLTRKNPAKYFSPNQEDPHNLEKLTLAMDAISRDSARKYIALQYTNAAFDLDQQKDKYIRLTVHEKKDRPDIPAIFTLGKLGGNYLSQNITIYIDKDGAVRFKSLVEILDEYKVKAVYAHHTCDKSLPLAWLHDKQPICFVDSDCPDEKIPELLKNPFKSWLESTLEI